MNLEFVNDLGRYADDAACIACGYGPADTEFTIDGAWKGYVCKDCLAILQRRGVKGWKRHLQRRARRLAAMAQLCRLNSEGLSPDAEVMMRLHIRSDAWGDRTVLGRIGGGA